MCWSIYLYQSPAQQSGTSEVFDVSLSACSLLLQQSGTSESVASLSLQQSCVVLSLWLLSFDAFVDAQPVTLNAATSAMIQTINTFFIWLLPFCPFSGKKIAGGHTLAGILVKTQNCPSHSERAACHNAKVPLLHRTHNSITTRWITHGHGALSFRFSDYILSWFSLNV